MDGFAKKLYLLWVGERRAGASQDRKQPLSQNLPWPSLSTVQGDPRVWEESSNSSCLGEISALPQLQLFLSLLSGQPLGSDGAGQECPRLLLGPVRQGPQRRSKVCRGTDHQQPGDGEVVPSHRPSDPAHSHHLPGEDPGLLDPAPALQRSLRFGLHPCLRATTPPPSPRKPIWTSPEKRQH